MNALLTPWDTEFGLPPFAAISDDDFGPAFEAALAEARANIRLTDRLRVVARGLAGDADLAAAMARQDAAASSGIVTRALYG